MDISKLRVSTSRLHSKHHSKQVRRKMGCNSSATVGLQQTERRQTNSSRPEIGEFIILSYRHEHQRVLNP